MHVRMHACAVPVGLTERGREEGERRETEREREGEKKREREKER